MGILMDPLTAVMLVVVTGVSLMIQIYSVGYMSEEDNRGYARYFAYMSLFTASMVGLVLASSVIQVFVFWELVGLCSYLLIGFWYNRHVRGERGQEGVHRDQRSETSDSCWPSFICSSNQDLRWRLRDSTDWTSRTYTRL